MIGDKTITYKGRKYGLITVKDATSGFFAFRQKILG